jgi:hypothetical protein
MARQLQFKVWRVAYWASIIDPTRRINLIRSESDPIRYDPKINGSSMSLIFLFESGRVRYVFNFLDPNWVESGSGQPDPTKLIMF